MMNDIWFRPLVWMDYRLAVLFTVLIPLVLLIWAFVEKAEAIQRLLTIYWRVSSLLAITVYLMIGGFGVSFISSLMARILIPIALWFWIDLNDEIQYGSEGALKFVFTSWRWATTIYCILGALVTIPFLGCAFSETVLQSSYCKVWLEAPLLFKEYFHPNINTGLLGFVGIIGLVFYVLCLIYFVAVKLGKQGRSAAPQ
ncbi:MAG: DUF3177 family protein [Richelia sp. RM2_1_2]|nr:DUF3177 family protein [Richelia sp. SM2_1_7]NJM20482.1 DUF3177 family protein [Richelia sp. SM1_7_0]NJN09046.1 DUF3177 family protein [Richelia sp. RM1_1_1]NJO58578.1 DUF3177 family protein [Richelia sp. RM2_1_2]